MEAVFSNVQQTARRLPLKTTAWEKRKKKNP